MLPNVFPYALILGNNCQREVENCGNALKFLKGENFKDDHSNNG